MNNNYYNNNQFFDYFKTSMNPEGFMNMLKNMPNSEHFNHFGHCALENMRNVVSKTVETVHHNFQEFLNLAKESVNISDAEELNAKVQQACKNSIQKSMESGKEILDMTAKSSIEAFNKCSSTCSANMNPNQNQTNKPKK